MDRAHAVPGRVAGESERLGLGGARGSRSSAAAGPEPRRLSAVELYDRVCEARVLGEADAGLLGFARAFGGPREMASGPEDPGHELVNEYTLWLAVRGIERCEAIAGSPNQPPRLRGSRSRESEQRVRHAPPRRVAGSAGLAARLFRAMLRYPVIPRLGRHERVSRKVLLNRHHARHFLEQLEWLKRRDEIAKQNALGKEISHQLASYSHTLEELEAPRYLSSHGPRWLYRMYGSLQQEPRRARTLASPHSRRGETRREPGSPRGLRMALAATASTGTNDRCCPTVHGCAGPRGADTARHNVTAERVAAIQAPGGLGLVETPPSLLKSVSQARRGGMIGSPGRGVERQLRKTARPRPITGR
ncbi:hypothetical protein Q5P01_000521 [Channa striata]|uniref:Uncharacterized protein n=1 Tax=Channa striata TaxID=64152 RepID=A0AA88IZ56_CHASR|nr:hypothetical protein Q5P01_000521 [Channa striata]